MTEKFMSVREVAKLLNVQKRTVQRLFQKKKLPGIKVGKEWRIKESDLEKWIVMSSGG
jgi:excisionase family DNA binding protein